ncbi:ABC transporter substrate-binding protein [Amphibacillus sp. Q70]|uniref:ABC transporter substrate-binding protein n=1 Tax=Amphibacillus sp. Q70 TaxID=3453416 RepID=UPI003F85B88E
MIKKIILLLSLILIISGCGNSEETGEANSSTGENEVIIEFFDMKTETQGIMSELIEKFEDENPDIKIEHNVVPDAPQVLSSRIASDDTPEIFSDWPNAAWTVKAEGGIILELTGDEYLNNIQEEARESFEVDGKEYTVPLAYNTVGVVYNKDIFNELELEIPKTYDELITIAEKIQEEGIAPFALEGREPESMLREWYVLLPSEENHDLFIEETLNGELTETGREVLENVGKKFSALSEFSQADPLGAGADQARGDLATGEAAMMLTGSWVFPVLRDSSPDVEFSMFPFPGEEEEYTNVAAYPGDYSLHISSKSNNEEEIKRFFEFMTEEENAQFYAEETGAPSTVNGVDNIIPEIEYQYEYILEGRMKLNPDSYWSQETNNLIGSAVQELILDKDIEIFVDTLTNEFNN